MQCESGGGWLLLRRLHLSPLRNGNSYKIRLASSGGTMYSYTCATATFARTPHHPCVHLILRINFEQMLHSARFVYCRMWRGAVVAIVIVVPHSQRLYYFLPYMHKMYNASLSRGDSIHRNVFECHRMCVLHSFLQSVSDSQSSVCLSKWHQHSDYCYRFIRARWERCADAMAQRKTANMTFCNIQMHLRPNPMCSGASTLCIYSVQCIHTTVCRVNATSYAPFLYSFLCLFLRLHPTSTLLVHGSRSFEIWFSLVSLGKHKI